MTSRQTRTLRRADERKAAKLARKAAAAPAPAAPSRVEINRANAACSTGPVTPEGKLASSRNSLKHGLASGTLIIPGEDTADFEALLQNLLDEHQPANTTEGILVHEMAQSYWLMQRALRLQNECFAADGERTGRSVPVLRVQVDEKRLALFLRYHTTHERAFHKALNTLIRLQKERRRQSNGFVSQRHAPRHLQSGFVSQNFAQFGEPSPIPNVECASDDLVTSRAA